MSINLNNYEAFFLDYHEGTLSPEQVAELMLFLEQHPELKAELEGFEPVSLNEITDDTVFSGKDELKKDPLAELRAGPVTASNFEAMAIAFVEGTLPYELQKELHAFIEKNPAYQQELALYRKTILSPETVVFEGKDSLRKEVIALDLQLTETEMLMIASVEGVVTPAQQKQLDVLIKQEQYKKALALYRSTKLVGETVVFPDKDSLRRKAASRTPFYYYVAAAASLALLIGLFFYPWNGSRVNPDSYRDGAGFAYKSRPLKQDTAPVPRENDDNPNTAVTTNDAKDAGNTPDNTNAPVLVKNKGPQDHKPPVKKEEEKQDLIADQPTPDTVNKDFIVRKNEERNNKDIELVNTFHDPEEFPENPEEEYLTLRQAVSYKVKNALLKEEMSDTASYREDKKKITWYDAVLVVTKGVRRITGRDVDVKKQYNDNNELIAYQFSAGKYTYTKPVKTE